VRFLLLLSLLLAWQPAYSGLFSNFIDCTESGVATRKLRDGSTFNGQFACWKGSGAFQGRGTLTFSSGSTLTATQWEGEIDSDAVPRAGGEIESVDTAAKIIYDRFHKTPVRLFEVRTEEDDTRLLSGPAYLRYNSTKDGDAWYVSMNGKTYYDGTGVYLAFGPNRVAKLAIPCAGTPSGLVMTSGDCVGGRPDGSTVQFHSPDGLQLYTTAFINGQPAGEMTYRAVKIGSWEAAPHLTGLHRNIVRPENDRRRDVVQIEELVVAKGIGRAYGVGGALNFSNLRYYDRHKALGNSKEKFIGGETRDGSRYGTGQCEYLAFDQRTADPINNNFTHDREPCEYSASGFRIDRSSEARREWRDEARRQQEAESDRRQAESQARFQEQLTQQAAEERADRAAGRGNIGAYIQQKQAEMQSTLRNTDRQIAASLENTARIRAQESAERERQAQERPRAIQPARNTSGASNVQQQPGASGVSGSDSPSLATPATRTNGPVSGSSPTFTAIAPSESVEKRGSQTYVREKAFEPDPYAKDLFKWNKVETIHGEIHSSRSAACESVKSGLASYMRKMSDALRLEESTACVCAVNANYNRSTDLYDSRWSTDHHTCNVYYRATQIKGGSISK
jgi:hypothetical protein